MNVGFPLTSEGCRSRLGAYGEVNLYYQKVRKRSHLQLKPGVVLLPAKLVDVCILLGAKPLQLLHNRSRRRHELVVADSLVSAGHDQVLERLRQRA